jgi:hypothetical protein
VGNNDYRSARAVAVNPCTPNGVHPPGHRGLTAQRGQAGGLPCPSMQRGAPPLRVPQPPSTAPRKRSSPLMHAQSVGPLKLSAGGSILVSCRGHRDFGLGFGRERGTLEIACPQQGSDDRGRLCRLIVLYIIWESHPPERRFFTLASGLGLANRTVHHVFERLRKQLGWTARGGHAMPCIHDLIPFTHHIERTIYGKDVMDLTIFGLRSM